MDSAVDDNWLDWKRDLKPPRIQLPIGSVDAHCHVFGPAEKFPFSPDRKYTPIDAGVDDLLALHRNLGISRRVIVQASCHGTDNSALLDALDRSEGNARGIISLSHDVTEKQLWEMHEQGVRGVRFNFLSRLVKPKPDEYYKEIISKITPLNWHVVVYMEQADFGTRRNLISSINAPVLFDHMGRINVEEGMESVQFEDFVSFLDKHGNAWIKISGPERLTTIEDNKYSDVAPFAHFFAHRYPDRSLWGTDWPHPNMKKRMPDDSELVDYIAEFAPELALQQKILVTNPDSLYWDK